MSFGSHNLESETTSVTAAPSIGNAPSCPLSPWLGWLVPWRRPVGPKRKWAVATAWGAKWAAALWVLACVKCIVIYIVVPSMIVWWGGSRVGGGDSEKPNERAPQPSVLVDSVSVSDELLEPVEAGR